MGFFKIKNIRIIANPEREDGETEAKNVFEQIIAGKFPNLGRKLYIQGCEDNRSPCYLNAKKPIQDTL